MEGFSPLDPNGYPLAGTKIGPAWRALLEFVTEDWTPQLPAMEVMERAGGIQRKTAAELIRKAAGVGFLDRREATGQRSDRRYEIRRIGALS